VTRQPHARRPALTIGDRQGPERSPPRPAATRAKRQRLRGFCDRAARTPSTQGQRVERAETVGAISESIIRIEGIAEMARAGAPGASETANLPFVIPLLRTGAAQFPVSPSIGRVPSFGFVPWPLAVVLAAKLHHTGTGRDRGQPLRVTRPTCRRLIIGPVRTPENFRLSH